MPEDLPAERVPEEPRSRMRMLLIFQLQNKLQLKCQKIYQLSVYRGAAEPDENAVDIPPADLAEQAAAEVAAVKLALTRGGSCGQTMPLNSGEYGIWHDI